MLRIGFVALVFLLLTACTPDSRISECRAPAFLQKGDKVALVSPSYRPGDVNLLRTEKLLKEWGFVPVRGKHADRTFAGRFAGSPEERVEDFVNALLDTSVKAIICNHGGYGSIYLVDQVDLKLLRDNPKWLVGFSDITTLHAMETRAGVMSVHATMSEFMGRDSLARENAVFLRNLLMGKVPRYKVPAHKLNRIGHAEGILVGGNMATIDAVAGTVADVYSGDGIILFLEELGESMHSIDRMLRSLELRGVLKNVKGVVLGEFKDYNADLDFEDVETMLLKTLEKYDVPVLVGFPAGHDRVNLPLVMGARTILDVNANGATLSFDMEGEAVEIDTDKIKSGYPSVEPARRFGRPFPR